MSFFQKLLSKTTLGLILAELLISKILIVWEELLSLEKPEK